MAIHELAAGIPRTINVICGNALLTVFAEGQRPITRKLIETVGRDFDLLPAGQTALTGSDEPVECPAPDAAADAAPAIDPQTRMTERLRWWDRRRRLS